MSKVHGISDPVQFDHQAADALISAFNQTANHLEEEVSFRKKIAHIAEEDWAGTYAIKFRGRIDQCVGDLRMLADSMRHAAHEVEKLSRLAYEEQDRRDIANAYYEREAQRSNVEKIYDYFAGEEPPPNLTPITPSTVEIAPLQHVSGRS